VAATGGTLRVAQVLDEVPVMILAAYPPIS